MVEWNILKWLVAIEEDVGVGEEDVDGRKSIHWWILDHFKAVNIFIIELSQQFWRICPLLVTRLLNIQIMKKVDFKKLYLKYMHR